jgi:hypothetical protein
LSIKFFIALILHAQYIIMGVEVVAGYIMPGYHGRKVPYFKNIPKYAIIHILGLAVSAKSDFPSGYSFVRGALLVALKTRAL